jgi:asparagine N-glycosylation enzyme membrane subunit Stt3
MNILRPKTYLQLTAAVLILFSTVLILLPKFLMQRLGIVYSETGVVFLQFLGAALAGHAYVNLYASKLQDTALRPALIMNIVSLVLAVSVGLLAIAVKTPTAAAVLILLMHLAFLTGFVISMRAMR